MPPQSLLIVDQSVNGISRRAVEVEYANATAQPDKACALTYIHDTTISGSATARNRAMEIADGDIWLFLDDDVILEADFVEQLLRTYLDFPEAGGVSGIITNYPRPSLQSRIWHSLFMRGPFHDERQPIYWSAERLRNSGPVRVSRFGGGLMSFYADAVRGNYFDANLRGVSDGEDVDFCARLEPDVVLLITPHARLEHRHSSVRLQDHWLRRSARGNFFLYRKIWNKGTFNRVCYLWLLVGYSLVAIVGSARRLSLAPYRALRMGQEEARSAVP